jgi:hypothetical protein
VSFLPDQPILGVYRVEASGKIPLGYSYGRVQVKGMTLEEAERAVREHLAAFIKNPQVSLTQYDPLILGGDSELERRVQHLEKEVRQLRAAVEGLRKKPQE